MKDLWIDEETKELVYKGLRFRFNNKEDSCNGCPISTICEGLHWTGGYSSFFDICYEIDVGNEALEISEQAGYHNGSWVPTRSTIRKVLKFNKGKR